MDFENEELTEEMKEESYVETSVIKENIKTSTPVLTTNTTKKVPKKLKPKNPDNKTTLESTTDKRVIKQAKTVTKEENQTDVIAPEETWLFIRDNVRYWSSDEDFKNGFVFEYVKDEEGDGAPGKVLGKLVNGGLCLNM